MSCECKSRPEQDLKGTGMNIKYIVAALRTVETRKELALFWKQFGIYEDDELKVNALIQVIGDVKYFDLPGSWYKRRMTLEKVFIDKLQKSES